MKKIKRRIFLRNAGLGIIGLSLNVKLFSSGRRKKIPNDYSNNIVIVENRNVFDENNNLIKEEVYKMIDVALFEFTGEKNRKSALLAVGINSNDKIALKPNYLSVGRGTFTSKEIIEYLIEGLLEILPSKNNIILYEKPGKDNDNERFERAGFKLNPNHGNNEITVVETGHYGTVNIGEPGFPFPEKRLSRNDYMLDKIVTDHADKIINLPVLRQHFLSGFTFALKNHYGSLKRFGVSMFHGEKNNCDPGIAEVNLFPPIVEKQKLIIGDMLTCITKNGPNGMPNAFPKKIIIGIDPVAVDYCALKELNRHRPIDSPIEIGGNAPNERNAQFLKTAKEYGVGNWEDANIKVIDVTNL